MPYQDLGSRTMTGIADTIAQVNPYLPGSGWDVIFDTQALSTNWPLIEVWQIALDGPVGSIFVVLRDRKPLNWVNQGWAQYYDPQQPFLLPQGSELQFCWNAAFTAPPYNKTTNVLPTVTLWLRADLGVAA